jgi:hypothetical protein
MRDCTCHPADNPPKPCPHRYALALCKMEAAERPLGFLDLCKAAFGLRCALGMCGGRVDRNEHGEIGWRCDTCHTFKK